MSLIWLQGLASLSKEIDNLVQRRKQANPIKLMFVAQPSNHHRYLVVQKPTSGTNSGSFSSFVLEIGGG